MRDKEGKVITKEEEQLSRWVEHFKSVLNRPYPETPAVVQGGAIELEMKKGPITCSEIEKAIRETKGNIAPGEDRITLIC